MTELNWYGMYSFMRKEMFDKLPRTTQLELIAFHEISGEEVITNLEVIDKSLAKEYINLVYDEDEE